MQDTFAILEGCDGYIMVREHGVGPDFLLHHKLATKEECQLILEGERLRAEQSERDRKRSQTEKERAEYERLKAKFEPSPGPPTVETQQVATKNP